MPKLTTHHKSAITKHVLTKRASFITELLPSLVRRSHHKVSSKLLCSPSITTRSIGKHAAWSSLLQVDPQAPDQNPMLLGMSDSNSGHPCATKLSTGSKGPP